jgi:hypothetical protein
VEDQHDGNRQPVLAVPSASDPYAEDDRHQNIQATQPDNEGALAEFLKVTAHNASVDPEPGGLEHDAQPGPRDAPSDELPETQASQPPLLALYHCTGQKNNLLKNMV